MNHSRCRWSLVLGLVLPPLGAQAGVVQTAATRLEGKVALEKDHVLVDGRKVAWGNVQVLIPDHRRRTLPAPQRLGFKNGEVWSVELLGLADRKLEVRSELLGKHRIDLEPVAVLEFTPRGARLSDLKPQTLYRTQGEPVPGTLLALDAERLTMDSPLGTLKLPRAGLTRFVLENHINPVPLDQELDEVTLMEGSILRGRLRPGADSLELEHPLLGRLDLPASSVRSLVRYRPATLHLAELLPQSAQTGALLGGTAAAARLQILRPDAPEHFVHGLIIEPKTTVRYSLPRRPGQQLRGWLESVPDARGDVRLRLHVGDKLVHEQEWKSSDSPRELVVALPEGDNLTIEVDFGEHLRFPCGLVLGDPRVSRE